MATRPSSPYRSRKEPEINIKKQSTRFEREILKYPNGYPSERIILYPKQIYNDIEPVPFNEIQYYKEYINLDGVSIIINSILLLDIKQIEQIIAELNILNTSNRTDKDFNKFDRFFIKSKYFTHIKKVFSYYISLYNDSNKYTTDHFIDDIERFYLKVIDGVTKVFHTKKYTSFHDINIKSTIYKVEREKVPTIIPIRLTNIYDIILINKFLEINKEMSDIIHNSFIRLLQLYIITDQKRIESSTKYPNIQPKINLTVPKPPPPAPKPSPENVATKRNIIGYRVNCKGGGRKTNGNRKTKA